MSNDRDDSTSPQSNQRRRLIQGIASLPMAGIPAWALAQQFPTAKVNTTKLAITDTEVTVVWPAGTRWSDSTHTAVTVDPGVTLRSGQSIVAGGGVLEEMDRSSVSVAPEVACLSGNPISFAPIDDVTVT